MVAAWWLIWAVEEAFPEESLYLYFLAVISMAIRWQCWWLWWDRRKWELEVWPTVSTKIWSACLSAISVDLHNDWSSISSLIVKFCKKQFQIWKLIGRILYYSDYLILSKNLENQKRAHSGQKSDQSMFKSEHQRMAGQLYISINLPSSLPSPPSPSAQWNEPE